MLASIPSPMKQTKSIQYAHQKYAKIHKITGLACHGAMFHPFLCSHLRQHLHLPLQSGQNIISGFLCPSHIRKNDIQDLPHPPGWSAQDACLDSAPLRLTSPPRPCSKHLMYSFPPSPHTVNCIRELNIAKLNHT